MSVVQFKKREGRRRQNERINELTTLFLLIFAAVGCLVFVGLIDTYYYTCTKSYDYPEIFAIIKFLLNTCS